VQVIGDLTVKVQPIGLEDRQVKELKGRTIILVNVLIFKVKIFCCWRDCKPHFFSSSNRVLGLTLLRGLKSAHKGAPEPHTQHLTLILVSFSEIVPILPPFSEAEALLGFQSRSSTS